MDSNGRDRKGHTAVAIAAIRGSLSCLQALVALGASIDIINYQGRDIATIASSRMKMAKQEGKTQCYAKILGVLIFSWHTGDLCTQFKFRDDLIGRLDC